MTLPTMLSFAAPAELLSLNDRRHWRNHAPIVAEWRKASWVAGYASKLRRIEPCLVTVELPVSGNRRRDPHNYVATVKPIVDGLVDAKLWPNDTPEWVTTAEPRLTVGGRFVVVHLQGRL